MLAARFALTRLSARHSAVPKPNDPCLRVCRSGNTSVSHEGVAASPDVNYLQNLENREYRQ